MALQLLRPHEVLSQPNNAFSAGSRVTEAHDARGLMPMLKSIAERPPIIPVIADYTIELSDEGAILEVDPDGGTIVITAPDDADYPIEFFVQIRQVGAGTVEIEAEAPATINAFADPATIALAGPWAIASIEKRTTSAWIVAGQLA